MKKYFPIATALAVCLALILCVLPARAAQAGGSTLKEAMAFSWGCVSLAAYDGAAQEQFAYSTENGNPDALWEAISALEASPAAEDLLAEVMAGKHIQMILGLSRENPVIELLVNEAGQLVILRDGTSRSFTGAQKAWQQLDGVLIRGEQKFSQLLAADSWNTCGMYIDMNEKDRLMNYTLYGSSAESTLKEILDGAGEQTVRFQGGEPLEALEARACMELGGPVQKLQLAVAVDGTGFVSLEGWQHSICAPELFALIADWVIEYGDNYFAS